MATKNAARKLDAAAKRLYETGTKVAGKPGGAVADAVSNTVLAPVRRRIR